MFYHPIRSIRFILLVALVAAQPAPAQSETGPAQEADAAFQSKQWEKAATAYEAITRSEPANSRAWLRLGYPLHSMGKYEQAAGAYRQSIAIDSNPASMYNLACAYARMNEKDMAMEWLEKCFEAGFSRPEQAAADSDLASLREDKRFPELIARVEKLVRPCKHSPEYGRFDFWLGEWDTPRGQRAGANIIERHADDCIIMENWTSAGGGSGKSLNFYNSETRKWQQTWVGSRGDVLQYAGEYKEGAMRFEGRAPDENGAMLRLTFFNLGPGRVRQLSEQSTDGGKTGNIQYDLTYIRKQ